MEIIHFWLRVHAPYEIKRVRTRLKQESIPCGRIWRVRCERFSFNDRCFWERFFLSFSWWLARPPSIISWQDTVERVYQDHGTAVSLDFISIVRLISLVGKQNAARKKKNAVKTSIELQTSRPNFLVSYDSVFNRGNELYWVQTCFTSLGRIFHVSFLG